jgi:hypothetical protein
VGHVACIGGGGNCTQDSSGERDHIQCGRIILKWSLYDKDEMVWTGLIWLGTGTSGRHFQTLQ